MMRIDWQIRRWTAIAAVVLACTLAGLACAHSADPVFPPGSRIGLAPPPGMTPSTAFLGFADLERRAAILFSELSVAAFSDVEKELDPRDLRAGGITVEAREDVSLKNGRGFVMVLRQAETRKWMLVLEADPITAIVTILIPDAAREAYPDDVLRSALATIVVRPNVPVEEQLSILPYRIGDFAGFRLMRASPDGLATFTHGPNDTTIATEQPFFMISFSSEPIPPLEQRDAFARRVLAGLRGLKDFRLLRSEPIRLAGRQGHEIVGEAKDGKNDAELTLVQWLRFGQSGYM